MTQVLHVRYKRAVFCFKTCSVNIQAIYHYPMINKKNSLKKNENNKEILETRSYMASYYMFSLGEKKKEKKKLIF